MANLQLTHESDFYRLLQGALLNSAGGYDNLKVYFRDRFSENVFPDAKWKELYKVDPENESGEYAQVIGTNNYPIMANYVAYDAEGHLISTEGVTISKKNMPRMKLAMNFNEKSFRDGQKLLRALGSLTGEYPKIYNSFTKDSAALVGGMHALRSYTGLQAESTGKFVTTEKNNNGGVIGLTFDFKSELAKLKIDNSRAAGGFGTKGKKVKWSEATAYPLGDLQDMLKYAKKTLKVPFPMVFRMNDVQFEQLVQHPTTLKEVGLWKSGYMVASEHISNISVTLADINEYMTKRLMLPAISVEDWFGVVQAVNPKTQEVEKTPLTGFADGVVLLRPEGYVGSLQWQRPTTLFATSVNPMYMADGDKIGVQQITDSSAKSIQFTAESTGIPVPENIDYFIYLDTTTASA